MSRSQITASQMGLTTCHHCGQVCTAPPSNSAARCPRCGTALHGRKLDALTRTWAYTLAAAVLYIPANLLPIMTTTSLFGREKSTILSGIVYFWTSGSIGIASLIFLVSIVVPLAKLASLVILALAAQGWFGRRPRNLTVLYRIVEFVGRWSMLDIFVVALMVGLVQFHGLAIIEAGPGAAAFGTVVVLTMLAARSFDSRLIWDRYDDNHG